MKNSTTKFLNLLSDNNIHYSIIEENTYSDKPDIISVTNRANNMLNMELYFFIANTEAAIFLNIFQCPYEKKQILSSELNSINADYRYVKFYISSDNDIRATMDVLFTDFSVADILLTASIKFIDVVDECYPRIMKCVW